MDALLMDVTFSVCDTSALVLSISVVGFSLPITSSWRLFTRYAAVLVPVITMLHNPGDVCVSVVNTL